MLCREIIHLAGDVDYHDDNDEQEDIHILAEGNGYLKKNLKMTD